MNENSNTWTVLNILKTTTGYFEKHLIENPRLNAERLLAYVLNLERLQLYLQFERILSESELRSYRSLVKQRAQHKPLQYIIGMTEFMGIAFKVTSDVFIPRPETEILIEKTLLLKDTFSHKNACIWDIGTGSGCIAVSLAYYWPNCKIIATDVSSQVLALAEENAKLNGVNDRILFIQHNILKDRPLKNKSVDIIISNPPYISKHELKKLDQEITKYEVQEGDTIFGISEKFGLDPETYLNRNDAYHFFEPLGNLLITGPTRTNVMDLRIVMVERPEE